MWGRNFCFKKGNPLFFVLNDDPVLGNLLLIRIQIQYHFCVIEKIIREEEGSWEGGEKAFDEKDLGLGRAGQGGADR